MVRAGWSHFIYFLVVFFSTAASLVSQNAATLFDCEAPSFSSLPELFLKKYEKYKQNNVPVFKRITPDLFSCIRQIRAPPFIPETMVNTVC